MMKRTVAMALVVALAGEAILSPKEVNSLSLPKSRTIEMDSIIVNKRVAFLEEAELLYQAKIAEEKRLAEEQRIKELEAQEAMRLELERITTENNRKNSVNFNYYDVSQPSGITATELYNVLLGFSNGTLAPYAWAIVDCEEIYGVNAFFLTAIIAQESGWGKSERAIYQNNLTGHAVYDSSAEGTYFDSPSDSIYITANLLANDYIDPNGIYHNGVALPDINVRYCLLEDRSTVDYSWSVNINEIANNFVKYYHSKVKVLE